MPAQRAIRNINPLAHYFSTIIYTFPRFLINPNWNGDLAPVLVLAGLCALALEKKREVVIRLQRCWDVKMKTTHVGTHDIFLKSAENLSIFCDVFA
jgi:hypothetical protein